MEISSFEIRPLKTQDNLKMQDSSKIVDQEPRSRPCVSTLFPTLKLNDFQPSEPIKVALSSRFIIIFSSPPQHAIFKLVDEKKWK
ncbi:hypothetical protein P5673_003750, partial [Acropora cervicornis]